MRRILPVLILLLLAPALFSQQIREFAIDTVEYTAQLQGFMSDVDEADMHVVDRFIVAWQSDSISYEDKMKLMEVSNFMLARRAKPDPEFLQYIKIYLMTMSGGYQGKGLDKWLEAYDHLAADKEVPFRNTSRMLSLTYDFLKNRNLYNLAGTNWKSVGGDFRFGHTDFSPWINFSGTTLYCFSNRDTLSIENTNGKYNLLNLKWSGKSGRVTWEKAGLSPEKVYADLSNYFIEMNRAQYKADSVKFIYRKYFDYPLEGQLEDKALPIAKPELAMYPRFSSYQGKYILPNLYQGIEYTGGLSMQGALLVGTGADGNPATLDVYEQDTLRMQLLTNSVVIREKSMSSQSVKVSIYLENDSIYHPDLQFLYFEGNDKFRFSRSDRYTSGVPYSDSYHGIDMDFEELDWDRNAGILYIRPPIGRAIGQAGFESKNLFDNKSYDQLRGRDFVNPLVSLWKFSRLLNNARKFSVEAYANELGMAPYQVRQSLMKLSRLGFIFFDDKTDIITLNDKLFYYLEASLGNTDYDVMYFTSKVEAPHDNAELNLRTKDLTIYGVPNIFLSDSQNVMLVPGGNKIIMKRNRNFQFDGRVSAGLMNFFGSNFFFQYDSFKINLQNIDSLKIKVVESDANTGVTKTTEIQNLIEDLTGEVRIDEPSNKSGLK
ncbi:MAG TPA: hypothetical protein VE870_03915, partial [Bacteroidales bacterium]|nr:hypothetical protein [Bacteroidales bacterium]